jgi:hypothetical protein
MAVMSAAELVVVVDMAMRSMEYTVAVVAVELVVVADMVMRSTVVDA